MIFANWSCLKQWHLIKTAHVSVSSVKLGLHLNSNINHFVENFICMPLKANVYFSKSEPPYSYRNIEKMKQLKVYKVTYDCKKIFITGWRSQITLQLFERQHLPGRPSSELIINLKEEDVAVCYNDFCLESILHGYDKISPQINRF